MLEEKGTISVNSLTESALTTDSPKDMRDNVVFELLSTERKYVQDLEGLQVYKEKKKIIKAYVYTYLLYRII